MTFLNLALLAGVFAFNIPLILHLFNRSRYRVVPWGAMHLLAPVLRKNRRRLRLEQIILLLIRAAIPAILALCLARPVITGWQALLGDREGSLVLLLDNSYSMEAGGAAHSNYAQARDQAGQLLRGMRRGSEAAVVMLGGGAAPMTDGPTFNLDRCADDVAATTAGYGPADTSGGFEAALTLLGRMTQAKRDVVLVSDFQKINWLDDQAPARQRFVEAMQQMKIKPALTFMHVGKEITDNVAAETLEFSRFVLGVKQKFTVRANLRNYGDVAYPELRVYFRVDGQERSVSQIALGPREQGQVLFTHAFDTPGSHVVEVFADADPLVADNSVFASLLVWDRVPTLLVSGDPSPEPSGGGGLKGETGFLEVALAPFRSAKATLADLIEPRTISPVELDTQALGAARVVVLANVHELTEDQTRALEEYIREGGGVLVFPGNRANVDWYNTRLYANGRGLLPARLAGLGGSAGGGGPRASIVAQHFDHPALEIFNDPRNGNLGDPQLQMSLWYKLEGKLDAVRKTAGDAQVLARLDTGDPFLLEKPFGEGRVLLAAVPCDADWSNLPARPVYLPLMQQLVTYLASKVYPPRNVQVGQPLLAFLPAGDAGKTATVTDPAGRRYDLPIMARGSRGVVEFPGVGAGAVPVQGANSGGARQPGLYVLKAPDGSLVHFVVNTDRRESDLTQLSDAELKKLAESMNATVVRTWQEYHDQDQTRRFGREIWRWLFWAVLGLMFLELGLEQWFAGRSR